MFSKPTSSNPPRPVLATPAPAPLASSEPTRNRSPKVASLISEDITIEGGISGDGELHIDGAVKGDIRVGRLTVGESGKVDGTVTAEAVECRGKIVGSITAKQVRLYGTSHIDGDITHEQLAMETGAFFQGRSLKFQRPAPVAAAPAQAASAAPATGPSTPSAPLINPILAPAEPKPAL